MRIGPEQVVCFTGIIDQIIQFVFRALYDALVNGIRHLNELPGTIGKDF